MIDDDNAPLDWRDYLASALTFLTYAAIAAFLGATGYFFYRLAGLIK